MQPNIRFANEQDIEKITAYLKRANLATEGIAESIDYFLIMEDARQEILATLGIEHSGEVGLLRSLAMSPKLTEADILLLFNKMFILARKKSLSTLYLATNKPQSVSFFQLLGFKLLESKVVPEPLTKLKHAKHIFTVDNSLFMELNL
ncbi:GNAT family N-acetyltransferase [Bacillus marasmi]|uniref:GNAT family N-acetyltransferase n=1 Tax=Bacillus marasmi TaxID=1926279 RepID=UPI0011CA9588|nr:hypothetical protein [Bacillus marasmi]